MLWFKKQPDKAAGGGAEVIAPVALPVALDERIFAQKFAVFLENLGETGGVDAFLAALANKSALFQGTLAPGAIDKLDSAALFELLETVMPARKRLGPVLMQLGAGQLLAATRELLYGRGEVEERLEAFAGMVPADADADARVVKKLRRAAWDFGAEMLHFRSPEQYPLMTRWIWDQGTLSGAMRELMKGGDTLNHIPLGMSAGAFEAGRVWLAERLAEQGVYRDPHFVVDLFWGHAYSDYMRAMSNGMGLMNADFGGKGDPMEPVKKLLGIDDLRRGGSRVRQATVH